MINRIAWYFICVVIITTLTILSVKKKFSLKCATSIMALVSVASEVYKVFTHISDKYKDDGTFVGYFITPAALPFHFCSILIFVYFYLALSKNEKMKRYLYDIAAPCGLIAGLGGIIFATAGTSFCDATPYQYFIYHAVVTWYSMYLLFTKSVNLTLKVYLRNLVILFAMSIVAIWINGSLSTYAMEYGNGINFMFMSKPPLSGLPYLNLNHGWFVYYIHIAMAGVILLGLVSLKDIIKEFKEKKALKINE